MSGRWLANGGRVRSKGAVSETALRGRLISCGFNAKAYVAANPDLADLPHGEALDHLVTHGIWEGRRLGFPLTAEAACLAERGSTDEEPLFYTAAYSELASSDLSQTSLANVERLFSFRRLLRPLIVIGDSHSAFWTTPPVVDAGFIPAALICFAASARGLSNPKSQSGYGQQIEALLAAASSSSLPPTPVLFKFGQVDLEFVHNFRRLTAVSSDFSAEDYVSFINDSVQRYSSFLLKMRELLPSSWRLIVQDVFPPCLADECIRDGYVNGHISTLHGGVFDPEKLRALEYPNLQERTRFHAVFNAGLDAALAGTKIDRLHDFSLYLGPHGTIDARCTTENGGRDHHLDFQSPEMANFTRAASRRLEMLLAKPDGERP